MALKPLRVQAPEASLELNKLIETKAVSHSYSSCLRVSNEEKSF